MSKRAFTLVELLVVMAIIGVLIALLLPAIQMAREAARSSHCKNNLKQIGIATHQYHHLMGRLAEGWVADRPEGVPGWGWMSALLPYLEQQSLSDTAIQRSLPIASPANQKARESVLSFALCGSDARQKIFTIFGGAEEGGEDHVTANLDVGTPLFQIARSNYVGVFGISEIEEAPGAGEGPYLFNSRTRFAQISDGLSNTFLVGERSSREGHSVWAGVIEGANESMVRILGIGDHVPNDPHHHFDDFASFHPGGVHFLYADGSVQRINNSIDLAVYQALCTIAGAEANQSP